MIKPTNETSELGSFGEHRNEWVSVPYKAKRQPQQDADIEGMRHRYAGAVQQHHSNEADDRDCPSISARFQNEEPRPVAPLFSLPPPPPSIKERPTSSHQSRHVLSCPERTTRKGVRDCEAQHGECLLLTGHSIRAQGAHGDRPTPYNNQEFPGASTGYQCQSEGLSHSRHCSHSPQHKSSVSPQPSPSDLLLLPPPPLPSRISNTRDSRQTSANYKQEIAQRCVGEGGRRDQNQLLQQPCYNQTGDRRQRDPSFELLFPNSGQGQEDECEEKRRLIEPQAPLRAQRQLLLGSSLPVNYCIGGSGEVCGNNHQALLQQQQHQQPDAQKHSLQWQQSDRDARYQESKNALCQPERQQHHEAQNERSSVRNSSVSSSDNSSPPYGSSSQLWPEPYEKEERKNRTGKQKVGLSMDITVLLNTPAL